MDLSRNLHEAMKPQTEIEMLVIRVNRKTQAWDKRP